MQDIVDLEKRLADLSLEARIRALHELLLLAQQGVISFPPETTLVNMHCHTFFSYNAHGHSPTSLAWLARRKGLRLIGIVDFDVLDGVDEFLEACQALGVRGSAGIETRVFVPEYAAVEINSLGEPGIAYHMGIGFTSGRVPPQVAGILAGLQQRAAQRNRGIVDRVNAYLEPAAVDYERDVLPLTPTGNPTERHLVLAYLRAAERTVADRVAFWAGRLSSKPEYIAEIMPDSPALQNLIRSRLMKQGGVGYVQPETGMFPTLGAMNDLIVACGALPCATWLDGTPSAEQDPHTLLSFMVREGVVALNIIPDRNWNVPDREIRERKVQNLHRVVNVARALDLPINIGTEMNSFGQKLVDDLSVPELAPLQRAFLDGSHFVYGHTALQYTLGWGYQSPWAQIYLPTRRERNDFYTRAGSLVQPGSKGVAHLQRLDPAAEPSEVLAVLRG